MFGILQTISKWLSGYTSWFVIAVAVFTFFVPNTFVWVSGTTQTVILGLIMLSMGLTLTTQDFKILFSRPLDIFIGACAQFILMPLIAYTLVHVFHLDTALDIGILLVGCCPGGVSSNIMSYLCKGDVAFSVGMTCASTMLAPVMTPLLMLWTAGERVDIDTVGMFQNILIVTIIPVAIGVLLNYYFSKREVFSNIQSVMPGFSVICLALIVGGCDKYCSRQSGEGWSDEVPMDIRCGVLPQYVGIYYRLSCRCGIWIRQGKEAYYQY